MTEDIKAIETIVNDLNCRIFHHLEGRGANPEFSNIFTFEGNGDWQAIKVMDFVIWDSENDEREEGEEGTELEGIKEDLAVHVLRVAQELLRSFGSLKLDEVPKPSPEAPVPAKEKWMSGVGFVKEEGGQP